MSESTRGYWDEHPEYPHQDWRYQVANGDTLAAYHDWVRSEIAAAAMDDQGAPEQPEAPTEPVMRTSPRSESLIDAGKVLTEAACADIWYEPVVSMYAKAEDAEDAIRYIDGVQKTMVEVGAFIARYQLEESGLGHLWLKIGGVHFRLAASAYEIKVQAFEPDDTDYGDPIMETSVVKPLT